MLAAEFTATVNAEMKVGSLEEAITVTGKSNRRVRAPAAATLDSELVQALPTARYAGMMVLIPRWCRAWRRAQRQLSPGMVVFGGRGGRGNEGRAQGDGLNTGAR